MASNARRIKMEKRAKWLAFHLIIYFNSFPNNLPVDSYAEAILPYSITKSFLPESPFTLSVFIVSKTLDGFAVSTKVKIVLSFAGSIPIHA